VSTAPARSRRSRRPADTPSRSARRVDESHSVAASHTAARGSSHRTVNGGRWSLERSPPGEATSGLGDAARLLVEKVWRSPESRLSWAHVTFAKSSFLTARQFYCLSGRYSYFSSSTSAVTQRFPRRLDPFRRGSFATRRGGQAEYSPPSDMGHTATRRVAMGTRRSVSRETEEQQEAECLCQNEINCIFHASVPKL
jgi:hypothetical protein